MTKAKSKLLLLIGLLVFCQAYPVFSKGEHRLYSKGGDSIIYSGYSDKMEVTIDDISFKGFNTSIDALVSFFYLGANNDIRGLIDMHAEADGSKRYIEELLYKDINSFSGGDGLPTLHIREIIYVGNHEIIRFIIEDANGNRMGWFEDFICTENLCKKSNYLNLFGRSDAKEIFNDYFRVDKEPYHGDIDSYTKIEVGREYFGETHPLDVYINIHQVGEEVKSTEWYLMFMNLQPKGNDDDERFAHLEKVLPLTIENWDETKMWGYYHRGYSLEKDSSAHYLSGYIRLQPKSYIETDSIVWVFVDALHENGTSDVFVFTYDKSIKKFNNRTGRHPNSGLILKGQLGYKFVRESKNWDELPENKYSYIPRMEANLVEAFVDNIQNQTLKSDAKHNSAPSEQNKSSNFGLFLLIIGLGLLVVWRVLKKYTGKGA